MLRQDGIDTRFTQESGGQYIAFNAGWLPRWLDSLTQPLLNLLRSFISPKPPHDHTYIACPKCDWRPLSSDHWSCSCQHRWHVFDGNGVCPVCGRVWAHVQCLKCNQWSDQEDWNHSDDDLTVQDVLAHPERIGHSTRKHKTL